MKIFEVKINVKKVLFFFLENLLKLVTFYSQNLCENETDSEEINSNSKYKLIKKDYLNNLKTNDNLLNLRLTYFNVMFNLIKFSQCELKSQFAIIHANKTMNNRDLFNVHQLKYFVYKVRNYYKIDSKQIYFNYNYLIISWLSIDLPLSKFPFQIEYQTSFEFFEDNYESAYIYYLIINENKKKLIQIFNTIKNDDVVINDENEIKTFCSKDIFKNILTYFFNRFLILKKKNIGYCEEKLEGFVKDLNLNSKELIKANFSSILIEILINFNETNYNINENKIFKMNILSIISFLIRTISEQKQLQCNQDLEQNESQKALNDNLSMIQTSTKLLTSLLIKNNNDTIHNILFKIMQSMLSSYRIVDLIRFIQVYSVFIEYVLFNNTDNCLFTSSDQQNFLFKSISSTIINLITLYKMKLSSFSKNDKFHFNENHKYKVLIGINNLISKLIKCTSDINLKLDRFKYISECSWGFLDIFEIEMEYYTENNDTMNMSIYQNAFNNFVNLLDKLSKLSQSCKFICIYLTWLTKSKAIKDYLKQNRISLIDEPIDLQDLFLKKLKVYFNDFISNENDANCVITNENNNSINYLIKPLLFIIEKLSIRQLADTINKNNGTFYVKKLAYFNVAYR